MRVKVTQQGGKFIDEGEGEVLYWGQTVTYFGGAPMQVPCVVVNFGDRIVQIPLQAEARLIVVQEVKP